MSCEGLWVFKFLFYQGTCVCNRVGCISLFVVILEWALKYVKKKKGAQYRYRSKCET